MGTGLQISNSHSSYNLKRIEIGFVDVVNSDTLMGELFNPDSIIIKDKYKGTDKSTGYGMNLFYGFKLEYDLSSIFGTSIVNDNFVLELDCRLIQLGYSKINSLSERIYSQEEGLSSYYRDRVDKKSYYKLSMSDPVVNFYIKYYF